MKLFLVSNMYPTKENPGFGIFVKNVCDGMAKYDVQVAYKAIILGRGKSRLHKLIKYIYFYCDILRSYFKTYNCLYVHFPNQASPILYILQRIKRKPMVVNFHGEDLLYDEDACLSRYFGHVCERLAKKAMFIVVPSQYFKDIVLRRGICESDKIVISPSGGINDKLFCYTRSKEEHDYLHLGYVGRLERDKGILDFIEACNIISKSLNVKATIIGYGSLQEIVVAKTKENSIFTVKFGVPQAELPEYYREFDLFCFPSSRDTESLGLVGIEAMACGTPVLGGNIGGIKSYIEHEKNGYLMALDNMVEEMVKYSLEYYDMDKEKKKSIIANALQTAKRYNQDLVCDQLAQEFLKRVHV